MIKPYATAEDGTVFNFTSPEVQLYADAFRTSSVDDVLGTVVGIYNAVKNGQEVAIAESEREVVEKVIDLCKARITPAA